MKWNWIWVVGLLWVLGLWGWRIVNWVWFRPKRVEKLLRQQGLAGNSYRFLFGDTKEITEAVRRARTSQPMSFSHHIDPRTTPYSYPTIHKYGNYYYFYISKDIYYGLDFKIRHIFPTSYFHLCPSHSRPFLPSRTCTDFFTFPSLSGV